MDKKVPQPLLNEQPAAFADRLGLEYSLLVKPGHKKLMGQFFTPANIAYFMSGFADLKLKRIKILDPGCGTGILSCALIEKLISTNSQIEEIDLVAFETDLDLLPYTDKAFEYLRKWLKKKHIELKCFLCKNDFVLHNSFILKNPQSENEKYHIIIANPPYFKINQRDERAKATRSVIYGQSNIYSIFLLIASKLLDDEGRLIFITPRSFCSGNYFKLFREKFFELINLTHIHLFISRKQAFKRDKVLQENIIVVGKRKKKTIPMQLELSFLQNSLEFLQISTSQGIDDVDKMTTKNYRFTDLVNLQSEQKIIHIPISTNDEKAIQLFKTWTYTLRDYDMRISTGPVVDFRSQDFIRKESGKSLVPLIYLHNVNKMKFKWPIGENGRGKNKGEYIIYNSNSFSRLVQNKDYIFLRRFSSKDDSSRLIASPYFSNWLGDYSMIGIENHLNYIYKKDRSLTPAEIMGLASLLNSRLFDIYFRTFNGNINVSATELRHLPLPPKIYIEEIGNKLLGEINPNQEFVDTIIQDYFKIHLT